MLFRSYPNQKLINEIKANFERLLCNYPSGMNVNSLLAAKFFGLKKDNIVVGNGAAELIKSLMGLIDGKIGVVYPTFEEYPNRISKERIISYLPDNKDFTYSAKDLINYFIDKDISAFVLINPDNPSGNYISKEGLFELIDFAKKKQIKLIIDESFVDFSDADEFPSLLKTDILNLYENLFVVKSISKSYGVPGLRLGIIASGNKEVISIMKKDVAIWNINSFGEFYLQICEKYQSEYISAMNRFKEERISFKAKLDSISYLRVIPSQSNYFMCEIMNSYTSRELTNILLNKYSILIKDLSSKKGFGGKQYIRIAIRNTEDNKALIDALKDCEQK